MKRRERPTTFDIIRAVFQYDDDAQVEVLRSSYCEPVAKITAAGCVVYLYEVKPSDDGTTEHIYADNIKCFDGIKNCPLRLRQPRNEKQLTRLLAMLDHLGSSEGLDLSRNFSYLDHNANPYHYQGKRWDKWKK